MSWLSNIFSSGPTVDLAALVKNGAQIIDVRTKGEFAGGHIKGAVNIPLNELPSQMKKIKKENPVITCCASGMRSGSAKTLLQSNGYEVYNGGGWSSLEKTLF